MEAISLHHAALADARRGRRSARRTLEIICEEAFRARDIAMQLLRMAEPVEDDPEPVAMKELAEKGVRLAARLPAAKGKALAVRAASESDPAVCRGHAVQLLQV